jgi:hypothetical protein
MALAAETLAVAVASLLRMTPTRTFSAVLEWLLASERISVMVLLGMDVLGRYGIALLGPNIFARRGIDMIHHEIIRR